MTNSSDVLNAVAGMLHRVSKRVVLTGRTDFPATISFSSLGDRTRPKKNFIRRSGSPSVTEQKRRVRTHRIHKVMTTVNIIENVDIECHYDFISKSEIRRPEAIRRVVATLIRYRNQALKIISRHGGHTFDT